MGEAHGLIISYSSTIGWSITTLNEGAKAFVAENGKQGAFILTREQHKPPEPPKMPVEPLTARTGKQRRGRAGKRHRGQHRGRRYAGQA